MNTKMTLGKRILSVFLTVIMVFSMVPLPVVAAEADGAVNLKVSELSKEENYETLYSYYYDAVTGKRSFNQNDSIEFDGLDRTDASASAKVYFEGKGIEIADNSTDYKAIPSEGEWLIGNVSQASNSGEIRFVHRYVEPKVYVVEDSSNIAGLTVGEADSTGMAPATFFKDDELANFYSGLDIKVRKTVDKLENGSFRISITGKDGTDYTDYFEYYDSIRCNVFWQQGKWINAYDSCLGPIPDEEVAIFIKPNYNLLRVKASVAGNKGGSISPADAYYLAHSTQPKTYTVTPEAGYEVEKIEAVSADGDPVAVDFDASTGKFQIYPSYLRGMDAERSIAEIKVYFSTKHDDTHCLCGGTAYDGHDTHEEIEWKQWTATDALPTAAGNYYLKNDVTLSADAITLPDGVNICLNGKSINGADSGTEIHAGGRFGITDCGAAGSIGNLTLTGDNAKVTMYNGKIAENTVLSVAGGTVFTMTGNAQNDGVLRIDSNADFTMSGNANGGHVSVGQSGQDARFHLSGSSSIGELDGGGNAIGLTMEDNAETGSVENITFTKLSLSGKASINGEIMMKNKNRQDNSAKFVMKDDSVISGKLLCADDSVSFEMQDNARIDGAMDVGKSKVSGTITCTGEIGGGVFDENGTVINNGSIIGGIFYGTVTGTGTISDSATVDVVIDTNGGSTVDTQKVLRGQKAEIPTGCKKDGYAFQGWYKGEEDYDFDTPVLEGFTLTAQWTANSYTVNFDSDGGSAVESKTVTWEDKVLDGIAEPTKDGGYAFNGWKSGESSVTADTTYADLAADDTVESITLTAQWVDSEKPTGEITIGEKKWNSFSDTTIFSLFFNEAQKVTITADDNSGETVKIEYLPANAGMTEAELAAAAFTEYDGTFDIDTDNKYVIYVRLTDEAGNVTYLSTDGFVIDMTPPVIEGYENGQRVQVCGRKELKFIDENFESASITHSGYTRDVWSTSCNLDSDYNEQWHTVEVRDKAGNTTTVYFYVHEEHSFDEKTGICENCGYQATVLIKYVDKNNEEKFVSGDSYEEAMYKASSLVTADPDKQYNLKLYGDAEKSDSWSACGSGKWTFDLNGHAIINPPNADWNSAKYEIAYGADITIVGEGTMNVYFLLSSGALTVDGACKFPRFEQHGGTLTVNNGFFDSFTITDYKWALPDPRVTYLCGGSYGSIKVEIEGLTCADLLGEGYRFDGISYEEAKQNSMTNVRVVPCDHANIDSDHICTGCGMKILFVVKANGTEKQFDNFANAVSYAEENNGCVLRMYDDVTEKSTISAGSFSIDMNGHTINGLNVAKSANLDISNGTVTGTVIVAKAAEFNASDLIFKGIVNSNGNNSKLLYCTFEQALNARGSHTVINYCTLNGALNVSGDDVVVNGGSISGKITVNNGGVLELVGNGGQYGEALVKSGGTMKVHTGSTFNDQIMAEADSTLTLYGGNFSKITVAGRALMDCLADGKAFEDNGNGQIIDGRVGIAGNVKVVSHTHSCVWNTNTHEKLCGCGYVEATDTEEPVFSGIEPNGVYYGPTEFTVTDASEFTVTLDGEEITLENGTYTIAPDNAKHTVTATDIAGNTISFDFSVYKNYNVTLPKGEGYIVTGETTVGHNNYYTFIVQIARGYSRTENFRVLANGVELESTNDIYVIRDKDVTGDITITVEGVADITPPETEISIRTHTFKSFLNNITFGLFFKETQTVYVTVNDRGSGIDKVAYLLSETAFTDKNVITGNWNELTLDENCEGTSFDIEPNRKAYVYVRATDKSGNVTIVNSSGVVVYTDAEAVTETAEFTRLDKKDVTFDVKLNGNTVAALYNGDTPIDSADYTVSEDGRITLKKSYVSTLAAGEYTIRVQYHPMGESYEDGDEPAMTSVKLTVKKRTPELNLEPNTQKTYDGEPIDPYLIDWTLYGDGARTWEYKPVDADDEAYTTDAPKNVGVYNVRLTTAETDNYEKGTATVQFVIVPRQVGIEAVTVSDKIYDGTADAEITSNGSITNLVNGDDVTVVAGKANFSDKNVGTDKTVAFSGFALDGDDAANYRLAGQPASVTADISVKEITINGTAVKNSRVYDGTTDAEITDAGTPSENYDGENLTIAAGNASYENKNVGTGKKVTFSRFALAGDAAANYRLIAQPTDVTADITVKKITIDDATVETSKVYDGTTDAKLTGVGTPSVNYDGENLTVAAGKVAYDNKNVGTGKNVTFTGFALTGSAASNYQLTAQPAGVTADITAKELKIVGTTVEKSKIYDGNTDAKVTAAGAFDGLVDGDDVAIVTGRAAYDDKNVGNGKKVVFYDFALSGDDAANYVLAAQPAGTTAGIAPKELTVENLKVRDKQYDGKNTAEIDGTPVLAGVVDGDVVKFVNGVPTFERVTIGKNIPVSFTAFTLSGDNVTVGNYTLTQPGGITANIVAYAATGEEYEVNSNDWIHTSFVVSAKEGYKLSLTDTADGEWLDTLTATDETGNGRLTFYVKNVATGVISEAVTENYRIDKTAPTGEVRLNERTAFQEFLNKITFGLFFKDDVRVKLTADDEASGVKSVQYFKSDKILTDEEVRAITDWTDNSGFDIAAKDRDQFVIYVRIEDNAGNVTYIGSDGATFDTTAPEIVGVDNGKTYYVTKKVAIDDENFESVTLNGEPVENGFLLAGDKEATYVIRAIDKAGNVTEYTVYMKPISSITDAISMTVDDVKSSDADTISSVERQINDISAAFDDSESTEEEWKKLTEAAAKCRDLSKRIADIADEINRLTDAVNGYDIDKVTSDDKDEMEKLIADIDTLFNGDNLTDTERTALESLKSTAQGMLDRITAAKDAAESDEIKAVDGITKDNVKLEDKEALEKAKKALEDALRDFDGNYTEKEKKDLETKLENGKEALSAIDNVEKVLDEINKLPSVDNVGTGDKSEVERVKTLIDGLTENEKTMLGKEATGKVDALETKIKKLAEEANSKTNATTSTTTNTTKPKTGDTNNFALWIALLFIGGGTAIGTTVVSRKKKHNR